MHSCFLLSWTSQHKCRTRI